MGIAIRLFLLAAFGMVWAQELRFALRTDPATFDPVLAADEAADTVSYLTGGVLLRLNRKTQRMEGELARSWKIVDGGKRIDFVLRDDVRFSDGSRFSSKDVADTIHRFMAPDVHSPIGDALRAGTGDVRAETNGPNGVTLSFSSAVANVELLFDQIAITHPAQPRPAVLGPYMVADYKSGQYVLLTRNPHYWKRDGAGNRLPYVGAIRLEILANRETELLRFRKGELHFVDRLDAEMFDRLRKEMPKAAVDAGPSLDSEMLWFNESPHAPIPAYRKEWFQSRNFRRALSAAIQREDMARLVYRGYAEAASGAVSRSNQMWFNSKLRAPKYDPQEALRLLRQDRFHLDGQTLRDRNGNAVEFSVITNAGSKIRTQLAAMLQQDFKKIGIALNVVPLEFQSLIERITQSRDYESCLLGLNNVELDPNTQMNFWQSSSTHHAWNPEQQTAATAWEKEIDELMKAQATALNPGDRKKAFDRVQEIAADEAPALYLVNPHVLVAVSPQLRNAMPTILPPHLYWNAEQLSLR